MKKTSLFFTALCIFAVSVSAQPQLEKGKLLVGVSSTMKLGGSDGSEFLGLGFSTTSYKVGSDPAEAAYKYTNYNILPQAGYFIMDNLAAGLEVVISGYSEKDVDDGDKWSEMTLAVGPFVRYYYPLEKIYPFAEAEVLFGSYKGSWYEEGSAGVLLFGLSLGAAIPLGEMVTFDILAGYSRASYNYKEQVEMDAYKEICAGFGIKMGFIVYLGLPGQ